MPDADYTLDLDRKPPDVPVASGTHLVKIVSVEKKASTNGEYLNWRLEIVGSGDPDFGKSLWHITSLLPQARFKLDQFLDALGAPMAGRVAVSKLVGSKLKVVVKHEDWQGQQRARVDQVLHAGSSAGKDPTPQPAAAPSFAEPKPTKLQPVYSDDIPF